LFFNDHFIIETFVLRMTLLVAILVVQALTQAFQTHYGLRSLCNSIYYFFEQCWAKI